MIEKIPELQKLADSIKKLKEGKIIRSNNIVGDLGEYYCEKYFGIRISGNKIEKGFDGVDFWSNQVQIKTRKNPSMSQSIYFRNNDFHYCLYLELDDNFELIRVIKISQSTIKRVLRKNSSLSIRDLYNGAEEIVYEK